MNTEKSYLCPLFWQHHEEEAVLREELQRMKENGIGGFIVEARPHPDYLEENWWKDLTILLDEAKKLDMEMWIFDDGDYPSGKANGLLVKKYPELTKRYMAVQSIDALGPAKSRSVLIDVWLRPEEELLCVLAGKRIDHKDRFDGDTLIDLSDYVKNGILYWDIPEGEWRIFVIKITKNGGEEWTKDYLNPCDPEGTRAYLDLIYEEHYRHFKDEFGKTIKGFFTDEPRFGNCQGYDKNIGSDMVLPWSKTLLAELSDYGMGDMKRYLPALWFDCGEKTPDVRYAYMDTVSRRFQKYFVGQLGDWCRAHQVRLIGHVVEENGAHARLGYGSGHYFRSMDGMDTAGIDVVNNIYPGKTEGNFWTAFNNYDTTFNHWGLSKMASSSANLDAKKQGNSICEAFGAYGWSEGLKAMKWITDAMCVRGINHIVPHAFSPAKFPDPDCPPHFYARGLNPQFRAFHQWSAYTNRVCDRISGGKHIAPAAVLYHAEAEWGGKYQPFEEVVKLLMQNQIDCEVVWSDILTDREKSSMKDGMLQINSESFRVLVVPYAEYLPHGLTERLRELAEEGLPVIFLKDYPKRSYFGSEFIPRDGMLRCDEETLIPLLESLNIKDIIPLEKKEHLAYYHYRKGSIDRYFFVNEGLTDTISVQIRFHDNREACFYDPMSGELLKAEQRVFLSGEEEGREVKLLLRPYESIFVVFGENTEACVENRKMKETTGWNILGLPESGWSMESSSYDTYPAFEAVEEHTLCDLSAPDKMPDFSGTIRYRLHFDGAEAREAVLSLGEVYETAIVWLNGQKVGEAICPPYRFYLPEGSFLPGENEIVVEVINTLEKAHHENPFDRYWVQEPTGLLGPIEILWK